MAMSDTQLGDAATAALWTTFGFMLFSTFAFMAITFFKLNKKSKVFGYLTTAVVTIAALAYLIMALGRTAITIDGGRDFLWIRYADWGATTPLLLIDLGLLAGITWSEMVFIIVMDLVMIASGFAGAVSSGLNATWPLFTFGCVALVPILYMLVTGFSGRAGQGAPGVKSAFNTLMFLTVFVWASYPIIWATGEGGRNMNPDQETIAYAVADILAKCVFGFILLFSHQAMENAPGVVSEEYEAVAKKEIA